MAPAFYTCKRCLYDCPLHGVRSTPTVCAVSAGCRHLFAGRQKRFRG